jgi:formylglycine-generating enzyme required for sulfatase activity
MPENEPNFSSVPLSAVERVDDICVRFEAAWKAGQRPLIEDYLPAGLPEPERAAVLRELLPLELAYRFPDHRPLVDAAVRDAAPAVGPPPPTLIPIAKTATMPPTQEGPLAAEGDTGLLPGYPDVPGYEILGPLGVGGMGVVYRARQVKANRLVALKMIKAGAGASDEQLQRFRVEAEAVARLQHPHIVQIYEVGEAEGKPFFALEFVEGGSLDRKLNGTPLPGRRAAQLVQKLAEAMHAAHERGIIHRDLKPQNVLLTADGQPKVTDFGLAKFLDGEPGAFAAGSQTQSGAVLGTPSYMAPEQALGQRQKLGPATDVYALGAILYELLTGRPPFRAAEMLDTLYQVANEEPVPPTRLQPQVPRDLETICLKCLQKESGKRYDSAEELANDLRRFQAGEPIRARPVGTVERTWKWARRHPALAALLGVVLLALVGLTVLSAVALDREQKARQEADKARKARDFLASIFDLSELEKKQGTFSPFQLLDRAEQRIPMEFADHPELRADLLATLEDARTGLGAPAAMLLEVRGAVELRPRKGAARQAARNVLLLPGDRLSLAADAHVRLVILSDLHQEWLAPGREATVGRKGCAPGEAVGRRSQEIMMTFVRLPKGTFYMGGGGGKSGKKTEIKEDFEIAVHAVTQGQWQAVMGNNPSTFSRQGSNQGSVSGISEEELKLFPVEMVSWDDAQEFIKKLNEKERVRGYVYRLPTEAEWEYACRGGATSEQECSYHFYFDKPSNDLSSDQANFNGNYPAGKAAKGKYLGRPTRVGSYPPNKLGLYDMHGNLWQWTSTAEGSDRVDRGGSWSHEGTDCQAALRDSDAPTLRSSLLGFRLARVRVR